MAETSRQQTRGPEPPRPRRRPTWALDDQGATRVATAVVAQAVKEASGVVLEGATAAANRERQMDAVEWLLTCPPTARFWIQAAGLDPENVASRLRARLSDRVVRMTEKRARLR